MNPDERDQDRERLEVLEMKVSFQDRTIEALNEIVTRQQDQIDALLIEVERVSEIVKAADDVGIEGGEEPPPPHY